MVLWDPLNRRRKSPTNPNPSHDLQQRVLDYFETLRVSLSLEIDNRGVLRQVAVDLGKDVGFGVSPVWRAFETCVSHRVKSGLRLARPARRAVTSARLELVLAIGGQGASP